MEVLSVEPDNGNASYSLGLVYYDLKNYSMAELFFLRALEAAPTDRRILYNLGVTLSGTVTHDLHISSTWICRW